MRQRTNDSQSLYEPMNRAIKRRSGRDRWLEGSILVGLVVGIGSAIMFADPDLALCVLKSVTIAFTAMLMTLIAGLHLLSGSIAEERLVGIGVAFLQEQSPLADETLTVLDRRAEIAMGAGPIRTVIALGILAFTAVLIPQLPAMGQWLVLLGTTWVVAALLPETDRANIATVIRHAVAEFRYQQQQRTPRALLADLLRTPIDGDSPAPDA